MVPVHREFHEVKIQRSKQRTEDRGQRRKCLKCAKVPRVPKVESMKGRKKKRGQKQKTGSRKHESEKTRKKNDGRMGKPAGFAEATSCQGIRQG
jgi:hypothetical protein